MPSHTHICRCTHTQASFCAGIFELLPALHFVVSFSWGQFWIAFCLDYTAANRIRTSIGIISTIGDSIPAERGRNYSQLLSFRDLTQLFCVSTFWNCNRTTPLCKGLHRHQLEQNLFDLSNNSINSFNNQ